MKKKVPFENLRGKVLTKIEGMEPQSEIIIFTAEDGSVYMMYHEQDCCENVEVEDVCGDVDDLIGSEILLAEEVVHEDEWPDGVENPNFWEPESFTWTFYKLATRKGFVDIRWFGESTGYYSESVDFIQIAPEADCAQPVGAHACPYLFRRICYPPEPSIRILNPKYPAAQPRSLKAIGSWSLFYRITYPHTPCRRIANPPEQVNPHHYPHR